jgi:hypothetical protein
VSIEIDTLGALHEHGNRLSAFCRPCGRHEFLDLPALIAGGQGEHRVVGLRLRCRVCGGRGFVSRRRSEFGDADVVARRSSVQCRTHRRALVDWGRVGPGLRELVISHGKSGYIALYSHETKDDVVLILRSAINGRRDILRGSSRSALLHGFRPRAVSERSSAKNPRRFFLLGQEHGGESETRLRLAGEGHPGNDRVWKLIAAMGAVEMHARPTAGLVLVMLTGSAAPAAPARDIGVEMPFVTLANTGDSQLERSGVILINNDAEWQRVWALHTQSPGGTGRASERPVVDFRRYSVFGFFGFFGFFGGVSSVCEPYQITRVVNYVHRVVVEVNHSMSASVFPNSIRPSSQGDCWFPCGVTITQALCWLHLCGESIGRGPRPP